MSSSSAKMLVFASGHLACVKIAGRANFTSSIDFKTLFNELLDKGYTCLVLDLAECVLMDSTFLGVLAGFGLRMSVAAEAGNCPSIELLNPNARVADLLENLGVMHLFRVVKGPLELPPQSPAPAEATADSAPTKDEVTRNCLEAHQTLMSINPANVTKFKDVAAFLAEDLKKAKPAPGV